MNASPLQRTSNESSISGQVRGKLIEARARDMQSVCGQDIALM